MPEIQISIVAVIIATIVNVAIGALWFNFLFGRQWLSGIGKTSAQVEAASSPVSIIMAMVGALIASLCLAVIVGWAGVGSLPQGAIVGLLVGAVTAIGVAVKNQFEGRPLSLSLIHVSHDLVAFGVTGAIIGAILP